MPKAIYVCEKCGAQFDSWGACDQHEENDHASINFYDDLEVNHKDEHEFYPSEILVPFTNGAILRYSIKERVKEADPVPEKSPLDSAESEED